MKFIDKRINDVCYSVELRGIKEHKIVFMECRDSKLIVKIGTFSSDKLECSLDGSIAETNYNRKYYSDIEEAKAELYKLRDDYLKGLHAAMIKAFNEYERMSQILRVYNDISYSFEEWDELLKGGKNERVS